MSGCEVNVRFHPPPADLARYFTSFYLAEITVEDGGRVVDHLHPEWGNLRFFAGETPQAHHCAGVLTGARFVVTGPSARAMRFEIGSARIWGIGLLPLGWACFVDAPAATHADAAHDGEVHAHFAGFAALAACLFGGGAEAELGRIADHFRAMLRGAPRDAARIESIHAALVDPEVGTVAALHARVGASARTVARTCHRAFGFAPHLLLRRQRFMRSLAQFMLDPGLTWTRAIDGHYHDQAQFVREFRAFMGMTPRQYARGEHPVLDAVVRARAAAARGAVQTLDAPGGML